MYRELSKFNSKGKKNPTRKQATLEKTLYQREYMEGKLEHKKIINIIGVYYAPIEWVKEKVLIIPSACEDVVQLDLSYLLTGMQNGSTTLK